MGSKRLIGFLVLSAVCLAACAKTTGSVNAGKATSTASTPAPVSSSPSSSSAPASSAPASKSSSSGKSSGSSSGVYTMGTAVQIPNTFEGIASVTVYGYYPNIQSTEPDVDTPPAGDNYGAIDTQVCAGSQGSQIGVSDDDFTLLLSNGSNAQTDNLGGTPTVSPLSAETDIGGSMQGLSPGQCTRGYVIFDVPQSTTAQFVQFTGNSASFTQSNSVVKWTIGS